MTTGIHHVTLITQRVQDNVDFYMGFLGLRLVKQTGGLEDSEQLHLFYGDALGSPGSVISFLVWEDGGKGRIGHGQVGEIAFAVPVESVGEWYQRALAARVPMEKLRKEFGETVLRLKDPDGVTIKLVGADLPAAAPLADPHAIRRLRAVTLFSDKVAETAEFLGRFGYRPSREERNILRLRSQSDVIDIRDLTGYVSGMQGPGTVDHVAFRAPDDAALAAMQEALRAVAPTNAHDRVYFRSLYVRGPDDILYEYATDVPGFTVDEPAEHLGETLFVPDADPARAEALRIMLPQFVRPGEPRFVHRDLPFVHRFYQPEDPDGSVVLLLHGTGGNESDLMPLVHRAQPRATLLGLRGRAEEDGVRRWFKGFAITGFDQDDIRGEAAALNAFLERVVPGYGLDPDRLTVLGYSNGANLAGAVMALYPQAIRRAALIRAMPVLDHLPEVDLSASEILVLNGTRDLFSPKGPVLVDWLRQSGAKLAEQPIAASHELTDADREALAAWLPQ